MIELTQVGSGAESRFQGAVQNQGVGMALHELERGHKLLQFFERERTDLVAGTAMQSQLDDAVFKLPGERLAFELVHLLQSSSNRTAKLTLTFRGKDALETASGTPALPSGGLFDGIHFFNFVLQAGCDQIALELAVCRKQRVFDGERFCMDVKCSYLFIVG